MNRSIERWTPTPLLIGALLLWQTIGSLFDASDFIFSNPVRIAKMMWLHAGTIAAQAWRTCWVTLVGFGIATAVGVLLGFLMGGSQLAYRAMYPLMIGFNALPKPALVPIPVVRFGIGVGPAMLTAFLTAFFPIIVNITTGLATL